MFLPFCETSLAKGKLIRAEKQEIYLCIKIYHRIFEIYYSLKSGIKIIIFRQVIKCVPKYCEIKQRLRTFDEINSTANIF